MKIDIKTSICMIIDAGQGSRFWNGHKWQVTEVVGSRWVTCKPIESGWSQWYDGKEEDVMGTFVVDRI